MSLVGNTPLQKNAMNHHGVKEAFFDTFFQKKATAQLSADAYTHSISENFSRFSFTGKERDEETGYGYFGARYMDHELLTMWLSVDRYASKYPSISPYAYCAWNPIVLTDPTGDSCKFASDAVEKYIMQLLDTENKNYSKAFSDIYHDLDTAEYTYIFESWDGDETADGMFTPNYKNDKTALIQFTMGETKNSQNILLGMSEFKLLFEETFHAWKYEKNNHLNLPTCYSEALAWQFSALAPGTVLYDFDNNTETLMGHVAGVDTRILAIEFKIGFMDKRYSDKPLYPYLMLFPNNLFRRSLGWPEWH